MFKKKLTDEDVCRPLPPLFFLALLLSLAPSHMGIAFATSPISPVEPLPVPTGTFDPVLLGPPQVISTPTPSGAGIRLLATGYAVVQWQDDLGEWRDVEGWSGEIGGEVTWYVAPEDLGTGPFRWVVDGVPSEAFYLPGVAGQLLTVE